MITVKNIFGIPIYFSDITYPDTLVTDIKKLNYKTDKFKTCWVSDDHYVLNTYSEIKDQCSYHLNKFYSDILLVDELIKPYITNSWVVRYFKSDYAKPHVHINSLISGIFYLNTNDKSGKLILSYKKPRIFPELLEIRYKNKNEYNHTEYIIQPNNGMLVLFPSNLEHYVTENLSEDERICIAFNSFVDGYFGQGVGELTLNRNEQY